MRNGGEWVKGQARGLACKDDCCGWVPSFNTNSPSFELRHRNYALAYTGYPQFITVVYCALLVLLTCDQYFGQEQR